MQSHALNEPFLTEDQQKALENQIVEGILITMHKDGLLTSVQLQQALKLVK